MAISSRTRIMTLGLSAVLAVGVLGGATAVFASPGGNGGGSTARAEGARGHHRHPLLALTLKSFAAQCDLTREELKAGFAAGQSINDIIEARGGDAAVCQANVLAALDTKLDEAVENGRITRERADAAYARAVERLPQLMDRVPGTQPGAS